jgi:hypothetical protein
VDATCREENGVACANSNSINMIDHSSITQFFLKRVPRHRLTKSNEKFSVRIRGGHVPKLAFWLPAESGGDIVTRMHLQRQLLLRIENLDEQWKT